MTVNRNPSRIAAFDVASKRLRGVFSSYTYAAKFLNMTTAAVHFACTGASVSCNGWYFRSLDNVNIEFDNSFGKLTLEEFDKLSGVNRVVYPKSNPRKKRTKTTKQTV